VSQEARPEPSAPDGGVDADPLDSLRRAVARVGERARSVRLVHERLTPYAQELLAEGALERIRSGAAHPGPTNEHPEVVAGRVIALDTINFGSGWHPVVRKRLGRSGAVNMANALTRWLATQGAVEARLLARLDTDRAHQIFDQPHDDGPVDELMALFTVALNDLGHLVVERYDSSFTGLVEAAGRSAATMVDLLTEMPFFRDLSTYDGEDVPFHKRAQLVSADLHRAFGGSELGRFDDLHRLTAFADNLVPHVLRLDGVLVYDDDLLERIDRGQLVVAGSAEEVEIRALGVHAVEGLRTTFAELGHDVPSWQLDELLWERGAGVPYKAVPRHRARSVFY